MLGAGWDHQEVMGSEARLSNCYETARLNSQLQSSLSNDPGAVMRQQLPGYRSERRSEAIAANAGTH